jgi:hypothetical protein
MIGAISLTPLPSYGQLRELNIKEGLNDYVPTHAELNVAGGIFKLYPSPLPK